MRHPTFQHQADDFWAVYKRSTCAVERRRSQLLALLAEGKPSAEVLAITRYSYQGANKIVDAYEAQGLESLKDQRHGNRGAPTLLSDADLLLLAQTIRADVSEGGVWNGNRVQAWVKTTLQKDLYLGRCYEFLDAVGYSRQVPRPRHVEADQERQDDFKKEVLPEAVQTVEARVEGTGRRVEVWCMDEHRVGLKPIVGRVWAERGKAPTVPVQHRYQWMYLYAFACPQTGEGQYWLLPSVNTGAFQAVLERFAASTGAGKTREIILVLDGAGWHTTPLLQCPDGITLVFLPPYSPELQPAERLWQLTDAPLKNRHFKTLAHLQETLAAQCRWLEGQWDRVKALTSFHWWPKITD